MKLIDLQKEYNYWLKRNENAEKYFKEHTAAECEKHMELFNEITIKLSGLITKIELALGRKMTKNEVLNGF